VKLAEIAAALSAPVTGSADVEVDRFVSPERVERETDLALAFTEAAAAAIADGPGLAAIATADLTLPAGFPENRIVVEHGHQAMATLTRLFAPAETQPAGIHETAVVADDAEIAEDASIGPLAVIGSRSVVGPGTRIGAHVTIGAAVRIGANCRIHAGVRIEDRVLIGDRVIIHGNAVIGADGFSFVADEVPTAADLFRPKRPDQPTTDHVKILSIGTVILEDDVEVGAGTAIDRGTLGPTVVGARTKIDNLVQIGHNSTIGTDCLIAGTVAISGSVTIGNGAMFGGATIVADHITVGERAVVGFLSGVARDLPAEEIVLGSPAERADRYMKVVAMTRLERLKQLYDDVRALKKANAARDDEADKDDS